MGPGAGPLGHVFPGKGRGAAMPIDGRATIGGGRNGALIFCARPNAEGDLDFFITTVHQPIGNGIPALERNAPG